MTTTPTVVQVRQVLDYQFDLDFGAGRPLVRSDEPAPLGAGTGPSPIHLLAAAVGNCLSASLLFALRKFKQRPEPIGCEVHADVGRNADGRLRVLSMTATLRLGVPATELEHLDRVLGTFESYCTVTQSVNAAIPVEVIVLDAQGTRLK